ncbi:MAG: LuxR family transcriptional regulator, partial [Dactylosporangium sp.]|nr:LuxR family transcriptional regulator [Dactylosporangium sp.]
MPPWSFVGRGEQLTRLTEAAVGTTGRGLILGGAAGIGKSRLLREGVAALDADRLSVWSTTANAATSGLPLGGLAQALPAGQPAPASTSGLLRWAVDALRQQAAGRPIVLAIDDAHLLDPLSATLVYYVARSEHATVLATVRTGEPVPDPVRALWTDDLVERIELGPLSGNEVA